MSVAPVESTASKPISSGEWFAILAVLLLASGLRFCYPDRLAVEHFDEGVYASNIWFGATPGSVYPEQHLYAPPLLPALIEWVFVFLGPFNWGAMLPSQVAGVVSVLLLWWLGRSWLGPVAGFTAATLCAVSEVHVLLSRSALTDVLLGMWWVAVLIALRRACESGRWLHSLLAGYLVGMAWYTKYNGWMPLAITIAAVVARGVCCRGIWPQTRTALRNCLIAGVTAFVVWSPLLWALQSKGGYASVMANHRQYVVGIAGWVSSLGRQWEQLSALSGRLSLIVLIGIYAALLLVAAQRVTLVRSDTAADAPIGRSPFDRDHSHTYLRVLGETATSAWLVWALVSPVVCYVLLPAHALATWYFVPRPQSEATPLHPKSDLGHWILLGWFVGLLAATSLYHPYLRLTLPWLMSAMLGIGMAFQLTWNAVCPSSSSMVRDQRRARHLTRSVICLLLLAGVIGAKPLWSGVSRPGLVPLADHRDYLEMSRQVAASITDAGNRADSGPVPTAVYVCAEPGLIFQLRAAGLPSVGPVGSLQFINRQFSNGEQKVYLVVGVHAKSDAGVVDQLKNARSRLRHVRSWDWNLGPLVALDQPATNPYTLGSGPNEQSTVDLYEVLSP